MKMQARAICLGLWLMATVVACSDDTNTTPTENNGQNNATQCAAGERYNPIVGRCVKLTTANNQNPNNQNNNTPDMTKRPDLGDQDMGSGQDMMPERDMSAQPDMTVTPDMSMPQDMGMSVCGLGSIKGQACAPSGERVAGATVTLDGLDCQGMAFSLTTQTAADGSYSFPNVASGSHDMTIASGSFNRRLTVGVQPNQETDLAGQDSKYCLAADSVKIAVIGGRYDHVEGILGGLQLTYEMKGDDDMRLLDTRNFLKDLNAMKAYDIIFINCGDTWPRLEQNYRADVTPILLNLRNYVLQGGSLYASDLAHPFVERALPELFDFLGDDASVTQAWDGYAPQKVQATVTSPALQQALGRTTVEIDYPHNPAQGILGNNWAMLEGVGAFSVAHVTGSPQRCANGSAFMPCPRVDGQLMNVPLLASYKEAMMGGSVVYTTFHNERQQSAVSQDILTILKFFIFQL